MVFSPNFVEKISRPNLGVKRKKLKKKPHKRAFFKATNKQIERVPICQGPAPDSNGDYYHIGSNFWKFYLIRTGFTLGEPVSLVKVFRLFRLERTFFGCLECEHNR